MIDFVIEICAEMAGALIDVWLNKILSRRRVSKSKERPKGLGERKLRE